MKVAYIDLETTGVNPYAHGIHQIAGIIEINGEVKEAFEFHSRPFLTDAVDAAALSVSGVNAEKLNEYPDPEFVYSEFTALLSQYVDKYNKKDKFYFVGYNSTFDYNFLREFFKKCGDNYFGSYFWNPPIDVFQLVNYRICFVDKKREAIPHMKLKNVAEYLGIDLSNVNLHNALDDIKLTREVYYKILAGFQ